MPNQFLYIANWKMQLTYQQSLDWCQQNFTQLTEISSHSAKRLIICPNFLAIAQIKALLAATTIHIGAQTCSAHAHGAYTGQVDALSLAQAGCSYAIIGHSERRIHNHETDQEIALQATQLLHNGITPIICVGETHEQKQSGNTAAILVAQLLPVFLAIAQQKNKAPICIAYEPVWAIGSTATPTNHEIQEAFSAIQQEAQNLIPGTHVTLLYGGSVDEKNAQELKKIHNMGGFLLGRASLDFQKLKNIVTW